MASAPSAAMRGQAELDLGAFRPGQRPLTFLQSPNRRHFLASFGDHVFEIEAHDCTDRLIWSTTIRRQGPGQIGISSAWADLRMAIDHLQGVATKLGGVQ